MTIKVFYLQRHWVIPPVPEVGRAGWSSSISTHLLFEQSSTNECMVKNWKCVIICTVNSSVFLKACRYIDGI